MIARARRRSEAYGERIDYRVLDATDRQLCSPSASR